ncbi:MAG: uroporphyrinogen decarboxylase family protein [Anaerolineae bacterium]
MKAKERVLATLNRQPTDRTPLDCWLYQQQFVEQLAEGYGSRDQFLDEFNIDIFVGFVPYPNQLGRKITLPELAQFDLGDPRAAQWIAFSDWNPDFAGVNVTEAVKQQGDHRAIIAHVWGIVEGTSTFLGIENCWANLGLEPELMMAWFDRYADWLCGLADSCLDAGVDIITLSDDWGSNQNMLFSPRMWRKMIKPYAARVVQHVRSRGGYVNLHSDGYILNIMDDLIELGYSSMHPVQESAGMQPALIKEKYGDKLVVYGSLDVIDGLFRLEGDELDRYITERFEIYAPGGGFIFNTGHFVQPDIPVERLTRAYKLANELARKYSG